MQKLISLALVLLAAGALAAWASGGTVNRHSSSNPSSDVAAIADASSSWAEFSSRVPNVRDALSRESQRAGLARARR